MKKVGNITLYSFEELLDRDLGPVGTPERDAFHAEVKAEVEAEKQRQQKQACKADETARKARRTQRRPTPERLDLAQAKFA
ncbi:MAG: hypothetical protein K2L79_05655 [Bacteroidales bacterium]|nr:hypothetical protein [Bacteroidales bacterium]